jgi:hypothetical protein
MTANAGADSTASRQAKLEPFVCQRCGAPIPVVDAPTAICLACSAEQPVPAPYREAVRQLRNADAALKRASDALERYEARTVPWWIVVSVSVLPGLVILGGTAAAAVLEFSGGAGGRVPVFLAEAVWFPAAASVGFATLTFWYSSYLSGWVPGARATLAARPPPNAGAPPECRECGAPLVVRAGDTFARCVYCGTDSLIVLSDVEANRLAKSAQAADADAMSALDHFRQRGHKASYSTFVIVAVWIGFIVLPCLWSLGGASFRSSGWAIAVGMDAVPLFIFSVAMSSGASNFGNPGRQRARQSSSTSGGPWVGLGLLASLLALVAFFAILYAECTR